jgi:hypothetical protein
MRWHPDVRLCIEDFPDHLVRHGATEELVEQHRFAGAVAARCGTDGLLDAAVIGTAARSVVTDPSDWDRWDQVGEALQLRKQIWTVTVLAGAPGSPAGCRV